MKYVDYKKKYADGVAQLWNKSSENWPEGLGPKLEKTAQDIHKELSLGVYLKIILAITDSNEVVGYCDLKRSPNLKDVCYIDTLNVHPKYQGLGIGRRLLKKIINFAIIKGYNRIDAFTWPANFKAILLYKKMGFFWQANTSVQMVNFIPKLFNQNFLLHKFIKNWEVLLCVKPTVGFDKFQIGDRFYYPYLFRSKQNSFEIRIDKLSQSVFYYKTRSTSFIILTSSLLRSGDDHRVEIKKRGFQVNIAKFYVHQKEHKINIVQNVIVIPSNMSLPSADAALKVLAQCGSRNLEFGVGFHKQERIESLFKNQFISAKIPQVGFRNLTGSTNPLICEVIIEEATRRVVLYEVNSKAELFGIDISNVVKSLPSGVHKIKFIFKEKSKRKKIATIERFLVIDNTQNISYAKVGNDMLIWHKYGYYLIRNPGAKLIIHSHNLVDRGLVYACYDVISISGEEVDTKEFAFRCNNKKGKIIIRAISEGLTKTFIYTNPGDVVVNYRLSRPSMLLSTAYFMDESAILKIGTIRKPITMFKKDQEKLINQSNNFQILASSYQIMCSLNKSIKKIDFALHKITYEIGFKSKKMISAVKWQTRTIKKALTPPAEMEELLDNIRIGEVIKDRFICANKALSLAVDPSFGPGIYSLKFNNKEILLTAYPKVERFGEDWPWYGGLYTLGCLANREIIDSFRELCLEEKTKVFKITSYYNGKAISGIFIESAMNNVSGLRTVYLNTSYLLLPDELIIISKLGCEVKFPIPLYFSSTAYIKSFSDMLLASDMFHDKMELGEEHYEIPGERIVELTSAKNQMNIRYLLYSKFNSNIKVVNLANKKGVNLVLEIKDYFKPSDFIVQHIQFKEV